MSKSKIFLFLLIGIAATILAGIFIKKHQQQPEKTRSVHQAKAKKDTAESISYDSTLKQALFLKNNFSKANSRALNGEIVEKAGALFTDILNQHLVPHWLGTPWDFNGVTQQPGKGQIACGYFVTTLLRDAGVRLNRVKLAQCASGKIINTLVQTEYHKNYSQFSFNQFIAKIKENGKGVFIAGLDFHTGFLVNDGTELYFVHSNYIQRKGVVKEPAESSAALNASKWRSVGFLTRDAQFLQKWLNNTMF